MTTGKGIYAEVLGKKLLCGNEKFLLENGVAIDNAVQTVLEKLRTQGKASILMADGHDVLVLLHCPMYCGGS